MELSMEQLEAVHHMEGPALCIAGPGSGKTAVIINRVVSIVKSGVKPEDILVVTFTRAAAASMEKRFFDLTAFNGVRFSTIHSLCYHIIESDRDKKLTLIKNGTKHSVLMKLYSQHKNDYSRVGEKQYQDLCMEISRFKACLEENHVSVNDFFHYLNSYEPHFVSEKVFAKIYPKYISFLERNGYYDYDDMTYIAGKRLDVLGLQGSVKRFKYLLIDEFQDTSLSQLCLLKKIVCCANIFAVGDDDQSVYSFRGASPAILKKFCSFYPNCKIFYLKENFRCNEIITSAANIVISENKERFPKEIFSSYASPDSQPGLIIKEFKTEHEEIRSIGDFLKSDEYNHEKSFAVLTRTNYEAQLVCSMLKRCGVKFNSALKNNNPFDHHSVHILLSFMRMSVGKAELSDFSNVLQVLLPEIPNTVLSACYDSDYEAAIGNLKSYAEYAGLEKELSTAECKLSILSGMEPRMQIMFIRNACGTDLFFRRRCGRSGDDYEIYEERVSAFAEFAEVFSTVGGILDYMRQMSEIADETKEKAVSDCNIHVMTLHASKGLEFDYVWILNVNTGIIPFRKAVEKGMIEEERRLFYVGMTRAKDRLFLSWHRSFGNKRCEKSGFLKGLSLFC